MNWKPGRGGLVVDIATPLIVESMQTPANSQRVTSLHITSLATASMAPLVVPLGPHWGSIRPILPPMPTPIFEPTLQAAVRPPHPTKDPPDCPTDRCTHFLVVKNQAQLHRWLQSIVDALNRACQRVNAAPFAHPEPNRFFHMSVFNNRGGQPHRSIGDINENDLKQ